MDPIYEIELQDCPYCRGTGTVEDEQGWCVYVTCVDCGAQTAHASYESPEERLAAAQQVAHAAADEVGRMAAFAQQRQHFPHRLRGPFHHAPTSPKNRSKAGEKKFSPLKNQHCTLRRFVLYYMG